MTENDTYNYVQMGTVTMLPEDASPSDVMDTEDGWRISTHQPMNVKNKEEYRGQDLYGFSNEAG